ncbi:zinc dependent phospholipase C family protein [Methylotenera sp.]|uniref:zinc dependent phospholipase C family protein n=1 Tax=Methylotenera sp. TaxID=2051956 RepID=UPI002ED96B8A
MTHLYFAQSLLWAMPLLDPKLQAAIKKFPDLVMAGACIPDLAIVSQPFNNTHAWKSAHQLLDAAETDEEIAIAIGYASHLYIDVIAHHHFVPAHEAMWFKSTMFTHITSEWAMDAYLMPLIKTSPHRLLSKHHIIITSFISTHFNCAEDMTSAAIKRLALGDALLRLVKLPQFIHGFARLFDRSLSQNFVYYISKTQIALEDIGKVLDGNQPEFDAELKNISIEQLECWREQCLNHLQHMHPQPVQYFTHQKH